MSCPSARGLLYTILVLGLAAVQAKPSHPLAFHGIPDHFDALPPFYAAPHLHAVAPPPPPPPPPPAFFPAPAPAPLFAPAPALPALPPPVFAHPHAHAHIPAPALPPPVAFAAETYLAAPAPVAVPAPLPVHVPEAQVFAPAPLPLPVHFTKILPPVVEAIPFAVPAAPTYRAIPGPKTTTHHISVGYAFPAPAVAKVVAAPVAHHHHHLSKLSHLHHSLF